MIARLLLFLIKAYQWTLSPILGRCCRFQPTCSQYAAEAIAGWGALSGTLLAVRRVLRCHPWHPGGYDPPPLPPRQEGR